MIGNKARNLHLLNRLRLPVPGFVVIPGSDINNLNLVSLSKILKDLDGDFISIRSSPEFSMPGLMSTILNVDSSNVGLVLHYVKEVSNSYFSKNCQLYRKIHSIPDDVKPSVILQKMVFGNKDEKSGSGVFLSRDNMGTLNGSYEFKFKHQGDIIVSNGIDVTNFDALPTTHLNRIRNACQVLEAEFSDPVEIEFTIESDILYFLQVRVLPIPNIFDYIKILKSMISGGMIDLNEAISKLQNHKNFNQETYGIDSTSEPILVGTPLSSGIAFGIVGKEILYFDRLDNDLLSDIQNCDGLLTSFGSLTSHISMLCRNMNIPYISGLDKHQFPERIIMDGSAGFIYEYDLDIIKTMNSSNYLEELCAV